MRARQTKVKDKVRQYLSRDRSRAHRSRAGARGDEHMPHCTHLRPPHREVFDAPLGPEAATTLGLGLAMLLVFFAVMRRLSRATLGTTT